MCPRTGGSSRRVAASRPSASRAAPRGRAGGGRARDRAGRPRPPTGSGTAAPPSADTNAAPTLSHDDGGAGETAPPRGAPRTGAAAPADARRRAQGVRPARLSRYLDGGDRGGGRREQAGGLRVLPEQGEAVPCAARARGAAARRGGGGRAPEKPELRGRRGRTG